VIIRDSTQPTLDPTIQGGPSWRPGYQFRTHQIAIRALTQKEIARHAAGAPWSTHDARHIPAIRLALPHLNEFCVGDACQRLAETARSIVQIMFEVGFLTRSNFNREFRRATGKSPQRLAPRGRPRRPRS
jgi:Helix-turn-helix domain